MDRKLHESQQKWLDIALTASCINSDGLFDTFDMCTSQQFRPIRDLCKSQKNQHLLETRRDDAGTFLSKMTFQSCAHKLEQEMLWDDSSHSRVSSKSSQYLLVTPESKDPSL